MSKMSGKFIIEFDKAFKKAIVNPENIKENGNINWDFVDADVMMDLSKELGKIDLAMYVSEFEFAASEYDDYREILENA